MVLGSDSMSLDVGRQHRLATAALRDSKICAYCANVITLLCTVKDGTSDSTPTGIPNSYPVNRGSGNATIPRPVLAVS
jgi:hypothetical protein